MLEARVRFVVDSEPRAQGSMVSVQKGARGAVRHQSAPRLYYWRDKVKERAATKMLEEGQLEAWTGPVGIRISFGIKAPQDAKHGYPKAPDLDKLVRAVLDALTGVCYKDDSQVVTIQSEKVFHTATIIEVWRIERQSPKSTSAQTTIWQEDASGMEAYPETGYRQR
jgi:crossover junction endodeoxyribonuclease RusA